MIHNGAAPPREPELTEAQFASQLYHNLRLKGWTIFEEEWDLTGQRRIDAIITRPDVGIFIGLELKVPQHLDEVTKALRQIIDYQHLQYTYQPSLYALITPKRQGEAATRFFWRWGIGVSGYNNEEIVYVNGDRKNAIYLESPEKSRPWDRNTPEQITEIVARMEKYR